MDGREYLMKTVIGPLFFALIGIGIAVIVHTVSDSDEAEKAPKTTKTRHTRVAEEVPNELLPIYATEKSRFEPEPEQRVIETPVHTPEPSKEAQAMPTVANDVQAFQAAVNEERNRRQAIDAEQNTKQAVAPVAKPKLDSNIIPTVTLGNPEITGNLSKSSIQKVVKQNIAKVRKCYENELAINHELKGKLTIQWLIDEGVTSIESAFWKRLLTIITSKTASKMRLNTGVFQSQKAVIQSMFLAHFRSRQN